MNASSASALSAYSEAFDEGHYWDAHEKLEAHWQNDRRAVWQALIQVAAAFVQIEKGHFGGAARVLRRGLARLDAAPATYEGLDVQALRQGIRPLLAHLEHLAGEPNGEFDERFRLRMADYAPR